MVAGLTVGPSLREAPVLLLLIYNLLSPVLYVTLTTLVITTRESRRKD